MKHVVISIITAYQIFLSPFLRAILGTQNICKFSPSCSEYSKQMIERHGFLKGVQFGVARLAMCR